MVNRASAAAAPAGGCTKSGTTNTGANACAENLNTQANGDASHAEGSGGIAWGIASHVEGRNGAANGDYSHVEGNGCRVDAANSHVEGLNCVMTNTAATASHAEGNGTSCTGPNAHSEGRNTTANADGAHAEGVASGANGLGAHAEGVQTSASHTGSHSEGYQTSSDADDAHAEGQGSNCESTATSSHAEGYYCTTTGQASHAKGAQARAWLDQDSAHAAGAFNAAGDCQFRRSVLKGSTNGSVAGQAVTLTQGILARAVTLRNSTAFGITVRATAHRTGLGSAPREAAYFHFELLVTVDSAGTVSISAPVVVVPTIVVGAGFVGATLGYSSSGARGLDLTFTIGGSLSVNSLVVAVVEYVEIGGN